MHENQQQHERVEIEREAPSLRAQLASLQEQRHMSVSMRQMATDWIELVKWFLPAHHRTVGVVVLLVLALCLLPFTIAFIIFMAPFHFLQVCLDTQERNERLYREIAQVEQKLRGLTS